MCLTRKSVVENQLESTCLNKGKKMYDEKFTP